MLLGIRPLGGRAREGLDDPVIPTPYLGFPQTVLSQALAQYVHFSAARTAD
jgi:hypothetical protein